MGVSLGVMRPPIYLRIGCVFRPLIPGGRKAAISGIILRAMFAWVIPIAVHAALEAPSFVPAGGLVQSPALIQVTHGNDGGTIFYTVDGPDPRDPFGMVAAEARSAKEPLSVSRSMTIRARVRRGTEWSDLRSAAFTADQDFSKLFFSELMYHPTDGGDEDEFVELKNTGSVPLDLSGLRFGFNDLPNAFTFPAGSQIAPSGFCILVALDEAFRLIHPDVPVHGMYEATLENFNDDLRLERGGATAVRAAYETYPPWQVVPDNHGYFPGDGVGFSLVRTTFDPSSDPTDHRPWRASTNRFGSPGADDPPSSVLPIYINELLTRTSVGVLEFVEFYNPNSVPIDLGGWWLSDRRASPYRYKIPPGTVVPPLGFLVLDQSKYGAGVGFNADGDGCYIFSGDVAGNLTGYSHGFEFAAAERDVSFGRHLASDGTESFPSQLIPTPGEANSGPRSSPIVISEIMYRPDIPQGDYIELHNASAAPVSLWDPANPAATWAIAVRRDYRQPLPENITLPPGGHLLLVAGDPTAIRTAYAVPEEVPIVRVPDFFNYLPRSTDVFLFMPVGVSGGITRYATAEFVRYGTSKPWPAGADAAGHSLERLNPGAFPNDPLHWRESPSMRTPGRTNLSNLPPRVWAGGNQTHFTGRDGTLRGAVADDRWDGSSPTSLWTQVSGPAAAEFSGATIDSVTVRFPVPGEYVVRLAASDGMLAASDTATIQVIDRPFDGWRAASFDPDELGIEAISHPMADPDHDLLPNVGEYVFSSLPKTPGLLAPLKLSVGEGLLQATWLQRSQLPDVVITPERADRIEGPWFAGWEFFDRTDVPKDGGVEITIREKLLVPGRTGGFIRLRYSLR
jgi:hypothetical protein